MARQSINFYQPRFHPVKVPLSFRQMAQVLGAIIALVSVLGVYEFFALRSLRQDILELNEVRLHQAESLQQLSLDVEKKRVRPQLEVEVRILSQSVEGQQRLLSTLRADPADSPSRFSDVLDGLLANVPEDVWVSDIGITGGGKHVMLTGYASEPHLLPTYVARLKSADALQGMRFSVVDMSRGGAEGRMQFRMSSREEDVHARR